MKYHEGGLTTESIRQSPHHLSMYKTAWRWHFYIGVLLMPFLLILSITGSIYLFKPQIENMIYSDYYNVTSTGERISAIEQLDIVTSLYPDATVTSYRPGESATRSSEVGIDNLTVYINPYTGEILGTLHNDEKFMEQILKIHSELMIGTTGDRIVELVACWTIILMLTGVYLWFPRKKQGVLGTIIPRLTKGKRIFIRDLHVIPAFWITGGLLFLVLTGLPWSGFWGANFQTFATNTGVGYPPTIWSGTAPTSTIQTKDIANVPWAAEHIDIPVSQLQGFTPLSIDEVISIANGKGIDASYTIYLPNNQEGVYTVSAFPAKAENELTMHIDQYTGAILTDYTFDNYGLIGKIVALGITLHKGTQFGVVNQIINLLICIGILFVAFSGIYLWWKRKPTGKLTIPTSQPIWSMKGFVLLLIGLGILFPLVGVSLIIIFLLDFFIIKRIPLLKKFFNA